MKMIKILLARNLTEDQKLQEITALLQNDKWEDVNQIGTSLSGHRDERTPLHIAAEKGYLSITQFLLERPTIDVNAIDQYGQTPLHLAVDEGHLELLHALLAHPEIKLHRGMNANGYTPLHLAVLRNNIDAVQILLAKPELSIDHPDMDGSTPLRTAVSKGYRDIALLLIDRGANIYVKDALYKQSAWDLAPPDFKRQMVALSAVIEQKAVLMLLDSVKAGRRIPPMADSTTAQVGADASLKTIFARCQIC